jgi:GBP family porin
MGNQLNKKLVGLSMLLAANGAFAQTTSASSVELYGILDIGVGHSEYSLSDDPNYRIGMNPVATKYGSSAVTGLFNGGEAASRIGLRGSEDLGGDLKAVFTLETGFNPQTGVISNALASLQSNAAKTPTTVSNDGSEAGQLFSRQANFGLSSSQWGTVTLGRNYNFGYDVLVSNYDPMDGSGVFSLLGYSSSYGGGGFTEDARIDNSIKYKFQSNGFNVGALYKFGGQAGSTEAQSEIELNLGYENGPFGIQGVYEINHDAISAASGNTVGAPLSVTFADIKTFILAASYTFNQFRLRGGYELIDFNNPADPALDLLVTTVEGYSAAPTVSSVTAYTHEKQYNLYFAGVTYNVTPAFSATVAAYDVQQNDYSGGTCTGTQSTCAGSNRLYGLLLDYALSKRTHLYGGYNHNQDGGGIASGFLHDDNNFFGAGIKHTF